MANNPLAELLALGPSSSGGGHGGLLGKIAHGASQFTGNLGSDILHAATGIPAGVVQTVEHPIRTAKAIGKSTWQDWSPLFHGHVHEWAKQSFDHPLAPLLDVASVFTGGAGALSHLGTSALDAGLLDEAGAVGKTFAKGGKLSRTRGKIEFTRPEDYKGTGLDSYSKSTSANPAVRLRQNMAHKALASVQEQLPKWFGDKSLIGQHVVGNAAGYQRRALMEMANRVAARGAQDAEAASAVQAQVGALLKAGHALTAARETAEPAVLKHIYWNIRNHAHRIKVGAALPEGYQYVTEFTRASEGRLFNADLNSSFEDRLRNYGKAATTDKVEEAAIVNGEHLVVPSDAAHAYMKEAGNSAGFAMKVWNKPATLWKMATVGYSPKTVADNAIGNWLMYAMRQGGAHATRGVVDAIRVAKSDKAALKAVKSGSMSASDYLDRSFLQRHFRDELHPGQSFIGATMGDAGKKPSRLRAPAYEFVHKLADQPVRVAAIHAYLRSDPEFKALRKANPSWSFDKTASRALSKNKDLQARTAEHVRTIAGDYTRRTPKEKLISSIIPFYAWDKHITKHVANLVGERPIRADALAKVGALGSSAVAGQLGAVPDYMLSELPIGHDPRTGRATMLDTRGLNPYSTIGDIASAALGSNAPGFDSIASQVNPFAVAMAGLIAQSATDAARGGGSTKSHGQGLPGFGLSTAAGAFSNVPEVTLLNEALHGTQDTRTTPAGNVKTLLNEKNLHDSLMNILTGVNVKRVDMAHAAQLAQQASGKKKKDALAQLLALSGS